ncbi:MAG: hypothetical protein QM742_20115, partial [Aquabacterium sp.]
ISSSHEHLVITLAITANFHQTPTLIGCQFLKNIRDVVAIRIASSSAQKRDYHPLLLFLSSVSVKNLYLPKRLTTNANTLD